MAVKQLWGLVLVLTCVLLVQVVTCRNTPDLVISEEHDTVYRRYESLPTGHPDRCVYQLSGKLSGGGIRRLELLPGTGWDNLQNQEMSDVIEHEYRQCRTTSDGRMLIPDGVTVTAIKDSHFETVAEVFDHWDKYTSTTSSSINVQAKVGGFLGIGGISGKYSHEYEHTKTQQCSTKSKVVRMQLRYMRYRAQIETGSRLGREFRNRLRTIAAHIIQNRTRLATYESQLLVRDYGSHVVNRVVLGAVLVKTDLMKDTGSSGTEEQSKQNMAELSASGFFEEFSFGAGGKYSSSSSSSSASTSNVATLSSTISSIGGKAFNPAKFTAEEWIDSIDENLVALDRSGESLHYFINYNTLHGLPDSIVQTVHNEVKRAVTHYYLHNTYNGCTSPDSPNFSFQANRNDSSCKPAIRTFQFGGVYQECLSTGFKDLCQDITVKNPITGEFSCPQNYQKVLLNRGSKTSTDAQQQKYKCGFLHFGRCYRTVYQQSRADYTAYWCAALGDEGNAESGMLFGGVFTQHLSNIMTRSNTCPKQFIPLTVLDDLTVCVSNDFEAGKEYSLPFAGFHSCSSGNPLALGSNSKFHNVSAPSDCPDGYSQHLAIVDDGCEINYCTKTGIMVNMDLPIIKKPPYISMPLDKHVDNNDNDTSTVFVVNSNGSEWSTLGDAMNALKVQSAKEAAQQYALKTPPLEIIENSPQHQELTPLTLQVGNMDLVEKDAASAHVDLSPLSPLAKLMDLTPVRKNRTSNAGRAPHNERSTNDNNDKASELSDGLIVMCSIVGTLLFVLVCLLTAMLIKRRSTIYQRI